MFDLSMPRLAALLLTATALGPSLAGPVSYSFAGTFSADDSVQISPFTLDSTYAVRLRTYSYGGGVMADGTVVAPGGFDPILSLFDGTGALIGYNDDAISPTPGACGAGAVNPDPNTHNAHWDSCLDQILGAGTYFVAITQWDNAAVGPDLAAGFTRTGQPNFTGSLYTDPGPYGNCSNGQFCDASRVPPYNNRTNQFAFDVVESALLVTEPSTLLLVALALAGAASLTARHRA